MTVDYLLGGSVFLEMPIDLGSLASAPWPYELIDTDGGEKIIGECQQQPGGNFAWANAGEIGRQGVLIYLRFWLKRRTELSAVVATITGKKIDPVAFRMRKLNVIHILPGIEGPAPPPDRLAPHLQGFVHDPKAFNTCLRAPNASVTVRSLDHFWFSPSCPRGPVDQAIEYWVRESRVLREKVEAVLREIAADRLD
jgi:hypothetical protein